MKLSLGFICQEVKRASKEARKINERIRSLVDLVHCVADEVWIKVVKVSKKWTYGFLLASPKSLFIYALDYLTHRDEVTMGLKVMEYQKEGFYPRIFTSDLLKVYRCIAGYFKWCLHQLCTNHGIKVMYKILKDLHPEAKQNKFFYDYMVKIKDRFVALFDLDDIVEIEQEIKQIKKELSLFQGEMTEFAQPMLEFIDRNWQNLFLYKKYPDKEIENTNNGAEIIYSLFKPHYKIMKHLQKAKSAQDHFETFTLRHNFRVFQRGRRAGKSPLQLEGIETSGVDWTDLIWGDNSEELLEKIEASALPNTLRMPDKKSEVTQNNYAHAEN